MQRGRLVQFGAMKSSNSSAVVFGSAVTALSSSAAGGLTLAHSSIMSPAWAGSAVKATNAIAYAAAELRIMKTLPMVCVCGDPALSVMMRK